MSAQPKIEADCPVCHTPAGEAGDGLPVYSQRWGMCGGATGIALMLCGNEECGVLFTRARFSQPRDTKTADDVIETV